jgi:putative oxidoreductase
MRSDPAITLVLVMTTTDLAFLLIRLAVGLTFAAHGAQKAFGWWGGPGPDRWAGLVERMGFQPIGLFWAVSIAAELAGGLLLAFGLFTPLAAAILVAQSIVIVVQAHGPKGFFNSNGGYEFPLVLGIAAAAICIAGPGGASLDAALGLSLAAGVRVGLVFAAVAAGVVALLIPRLVAVAPGIEARSNLRRG